MVTNTCPACGQPLAIDDINIKEGVGLCRACGKLSPLSLIAEVPAADPSLLAKPPDGCSFAEPMGGGLIVRASLRSPGTAVAMLAICLFWNGIVSIFVLLAIAGLYTNLIGPLPHWFPGPPGGKSGSNIGMPLGMAIFLCIFLIPFVTIGLILIGTFLNMVMGRIEVRIESGIGLVRTGFGPFNWTRKFDASKVKRVIDGQTSWESNGRRQQVVQLETEDKTIKFGSMLTERRREWMMGLLHVLLVAPTKAARSKLGLSPVAR